LTDGAEAAEVAVRRQLDQLGIDVEVVPCDPAQADTAAFCEAYGYALDDSANTIVVAGRADPPRYAACLVLATTRLDVNRVVRRRLGVSKASFASADATHELTGMALGGVTVFGLPDGLPIWVDARVMTRERIVLGGGSRRCKILAAPGVLRMIPGVEVVDDLAAPARAEQP
jgi:prolyl-tRNA editing enzyme YbaK/EbsC (Cys-tRNA(Pro) deacylase)